MFLHLCLIMDHRRHQNVVKRTSVKHSAVPHVWLFFLITFYCHLWSTTEYMQDNMKSRFSTGTCCKSLLVTKIWKNITLCSGDMMGSAGENLPTNFCSKVGGNFRRTLNKILWFLFALFLHVTAQNMTQLIITYYRVLTVIQELYTSLNYIQLIQWVLNIQILIISLGRRWGMPYVDATWGLLGWSYH